MNKSGLNGVVFATKEMNMEKQAIPKRGHVGWRCGESGIPIEVVFVDSLEGDADWIPIITYREKKAERKRVNRDHYARNPLLLQQKIQEKKKGRYLGFFLRNSVAYDRNTGSE